MTITASRSLAEQRLRSWLLGVDSEVKFWDYWFATKGGDWPQDFEIRLDPKREFPEYLLDGLSPKTAKILDVGAGPITGFGFTHKGSKLDITACDPLASFYDRVLEKYSITPPVRTITAFAEELSSFFSTNTFDLVTCSNALDHSFEPIRGIEEMLLVTRIGGRVHLTHRINEAVFGHYTGLHQWNFDAENNRFIMWNNEQRIDVNSVFNSCAEIKVIYDPPAGYVTAVFQKTAEPSDNSRDRYRARISELLPATMQVIQSLVDDGLVKPSTFSLK
jgi:SAM-dependent methyltransferase